MQAMFLTIAFFIVGDVDSDAAAALALAQAQVKPKPVEPIKEPTKAIDASKPYILFVGIDERSVTGYQTVRDDDYFVEPGMYIVMPGSKFHKLFNLADAHVEIQRLESRVSQPAIPFGFLRRGEVRRLQTVDDKNDVPQLAELLDGMELYTTSTMTQHTGRRQVGVISPAPRTNLENKWLVPGHLDGVQGWSSKLYKTKGVKASVFLVAQDPRDPVSAITWGRSYPDVDFVDILRNAEGKVFEARVASKREGHWDRFVAFSDSSARPAGYVRPTSKQCAECHNQAGVSAYNDAAIPGADTILSDPFENLEAGQSVQGGFRTRL